MTTVLRSATVGLLLPAGAILLVGLLELALQRLAPNIHDRLIGFTNMGTVAQAVAVLLLFFTCGFHGPRWGGSRWTVLWILAPITLLYGAAIIRSPYLYGLNTQNIGMTLFIHSPFLLPALATLAGYSSHRLLSRTPQRTA